MRAVPVPAPDTIRAAVAALARASGYAFEITDAPVEGTALWVAYARDHPFGSRYTAATGILGFRIPQNFPDACPEDSFFIQPADIKLSEPDPIRRSVDVHRAGANSDFLRGTGLAGNVLVFSWHLWNRVAWDRRKHTLMDHYTHCLRRFDAPEHD